MVPESNLIKRLDSGTTNYNQIMMINHKQIMMTGFKASQKGKAGVYLTRITLDSIT